jgi:hypothetical protein
VCAKRVYAGSLGSYLVNYLAVSWLRIEAVQGPVGSRLGASILLAVQ